MDEVWDFGVLGPLELRRPAGRDTLTAPKLRSLLSLLLLDSAPVAPGRVRAVLDEADRWRDEAGPMHVAIHRLRRWLARHGEHRLEFGPGGYRLTVADGSVDAEQFRRLLAGTRAATDPEERVNGLVAALSLWRGPVAADAPEVVRNQEAARQLERFYRQATVELAGTCLASGQAFRSLPLVERAAATSPYDEQLQGLLASTLAACGLPAEALAVIDRTRRTLRADLGLDPGPYLRTAQLGILRQQNQAA